MQITIELPDDIAERLTQRVSSLSHQTLEALAVEGYRTQLFSHEEVGRILNISQWEVEALLKKANAYLHHDETDLAQNEATIKGSEQLPTIAETFDRIRKICVEEDFELELPPRKDRLNPFLADDFSL